MEDADEDDLTATAAQSEEVEVVSGGSKQMQHRHHHHQKKGRRGWQWIVLALSAMNVAFLCGKYRVFGIFVDELHNEMVRQQQQQLPRPDLKQSSNTTEMTTATVASAVVVGATAQELHWIGDSYAAVCYLSVGLFSWLILWHDRRYRLSMFVAGLLILTACVASALLHSVRWLFLTQTLLDSLGSGLVLATTALIVAEYFPPSHEFHVLATTIVSSGSLVSVAFLTGFCALIDMCGWRPAFLLLGLSYTGVVWAAALGFRGSGGLKVSGPRLVGGLALWQRSLRQFETYRLVLLAGWLCDRVLTSVVTYGLRLALAPDPASLLPVDQMGEPNSVSARLRDGLVIPFTFGECLACVVSLLVTAVTRHWLHGRLRWLLLLSSAATAASLLSVAYMAVAPVANSGSSSSDWRQPQHSYSWRKLLAILCGLFLAPSIGFTYPASQEMTLLPGDVGFPLSLMAIGVGMVFAPLLCTSILHRFKYRWFMMTLGIMMLMKTMCLLVGVTILRRHGKRGGSGDSSNSGVSSGGRRHRGSCHGDRELLLEECYDETQPQSGAVGAEDEGAFGSGMKRDNSSFLPLPQSQENDNGWDRIDLEGDAAMVMGADELQTRI